MPVLRQYVDLYRQKLARTDSVYIPNKSYPVFTDKTQERRTEQRHFHRSRWSRAIVACTPGVLPVHLRSHLLRIL